MLQDFTIALAQVSVCKTLSYKALSSKTTFNTDLLRSLTYFRFDLCVFVGEKNKSD